MVFGVDEEDDAADFGEVVAPETAGCEGRGWLVVEGLDGDFDYVIG